MTERLTYTVEEAAELMGLSVSGAYRFVRRGQIPCIRIGRRLLIPRTALQSYLDEVGEPSPRIDSWAPRETPWEAALRRGRQNRE